MGREGPRGLATRTITTRRLLSHTSGLTCGFTHDSGRGGDCLAKYVEAAKNVALDDLLLTPLGLTRTMTLPEQALRFRAAMGTWASRVRRWNRHRNGT
ncbi:hypothetical protein [Streptomyces chrestomyceticus]|uniref:hypothetical protein n=1 Tax=Streptomyces chrestomyceticus TaxID=68185 RepID=UPI0035A8F00E